MGRNAASGQIPEHVHPVDLRAAHRNHRHQSRAPNSHQARRVTSETGKGVTSLSGVYSWASFRFRLWNLPGRWVAERAEEQAEVRPWPQHEVIVDVRFGCWCWPVGGVGEWRSSTPSTGLAAERSYAAVRAGRS